MTTRLPIKLNIVLPLAGALLMACNGFVGEWMILEGFSSRFSRVQDGQTRQEVVTSLGEPARESSVFELPQRKGYEELFQEAADSRASRFLYWDTGIDEVAVIGLSEDARVVFKCRAGT